MKDYSKDYKKSGCFECQESETVVELSPSFVLPNTCIMVCISRGLTYNRYPFGGQSMSRRLPNDFFKSFLLQLDVLKYYFFVLQGRTHSMQSPWRVLYSCQVLYSHIFVSFSVKKLPKNFA